MVREAARALLNLQVLFPSESCIKLSFHFETKQRILITFSLMLYIYNEYIIHV